MCKMDDHLLATLIMWKQTISNEGVSRKLRRIFVYNKKSVSVLFTAGSVPREPEQTQIHFTVSHF